jgi:hypothetical protein
MCSFTTKLHDHLYVRMLLTAIWDLCRAFLSHLVVVKSYHMLTTLCCHVVTTTFSGATASSLRLLLIAIITCIPMMRSALV